MHQKCFAPIASSDAPASLRAVMTCGEVTLQTLEGWWSSSNGTWYCIQADVVRACAQTAEGDGLSIGSCSGEAASARGKRS